MAKRGEREVNSSWACPSLPICEPVPLAKLCLLSPSGGAGAGAGMSILLALLLSARVWLCEDLFY